VPVGRRGKKVSGTSSKINVRYVTFTPEEMAIDCPIDTSDPEKYPTITRGEKDWKKFLNFKNGFVRLDPKLRKVFRSSQQVNQTLLEVLKKDRAEGRRKSA